MVCLYSVYRPRTAVRTAGGELSGMYQFQKDYYQFQKYHVLTEVCCYDRSSALSSLNSCQPGAWKDGVTLLPGISVGRNSKPVLALRQAMAHITETFALESRNRSYRAG